MKIVALLLCFLAIGCRDPGLTRATKCGLSCYTLESGSVKQGTCRPGTWVCTDSESDEDATCEGQVGPTEEICDGIDNDCNGVPDDSFGGRYPLRQSCENACGKGMQICRVGIWGECSAPGPKPEVCNGLDDDCDGSADEVEDLPISYCYHGSSGSVQFGECRPGINRCVFGVDTCVGEVLPRPESCDNLDNDCDGTVDEGFGADDKFDIVIVIDNSGSMGTVIAAVKMATSGFVTAYNTRTEIAWALVTAPDKDPVYDHQVRLVTNLGSAADLNAAVQQQMATGGGSEATLDAIELVARSSNPLGLHWRPGSKHIIIMFTDEEPQSYQSPALSVSDTYAALAASILTAHVFTLPSMAPYWKPVGPPSQFDVQNLSDDPMEMVAALTTLIKEATCR